MAIPYGLMLEDDRDLPLWPYLDNGPRQVAQRIETALRVELGEWFLDVTKGMPKYKWLNFRKTPLIEINNKSRSVVLGVAGVTRIARWETKLVARVVTTTGEVYIEGEERPLGAIILPLGTPQNTSSASWFSYAYGGVGSVVGGA